MNIADIKLNAQLISYLLAEDVLEEFMENLFDSLERCEVNGSVECTTIKGAFAWVDTTEGYGFWQDLSDRYMALGASETNDEEEPEIILSPPQEYSAAVLLDKLTNSNRADLNAEYLKPLAELTTKLVFFGDQGDEEAVAVIKAILEGRLVSIEMASDGEVRVVTEQESKDA